MSEGPIRSAHDLSAGWTSGAPTGLGLPARVPAPPPRAADTTAPVLHGAASAIQPPFSERLLHENRRAMRPPIGASSPHRRYDPSSGAEAGERRAGPPLTAEGGRSARTEGLSVRADDLLGCHQQIGHLIRPSAGDIWCREGETAPTGTGNSSFTGADDHRCIVGLHVGMLVRCLVRAALTDLLMLQSPQR